jgi:hypothetical protein
VVVVEAFMAVEAVGIMAATGMVATGMVASGMAAIGMVAIGTATAGGGRTTTGTLGATPITPLIEDIVLTILVIVTVGVSMITIDQMIKGPLS